MLQHTLDEIHSSDQASGESNGDEDCCVICLENVSEPCVAHPCAHHNFDFLCLVSWLQEQAACPLCKSQVQEVRYEFSQDRKRWKAYKVGSQKQPETTSSAAAGRSTRLYQGTRLAQHRQRREYRPRPQVTPDEAILRRRDIYSNQLYSLHVGSNRLSRYKDLTPDLFETDPELVSRARKWIRRELQVFQFLSSGTVAEPRQDAAGSRRRADNAEILLEYIIAILKTIDTQGSCGQAEDMLQEFLGRENTRLFLHELRAWLRSPYTSLEDWDRHVQYDQSKKRTPREASAGAGGGDDGSSNGESSQGRRSGSSHWRPRNSNRHHPYRGQRDRNYARLREASRRWAPD